MTVGLPYMSQKDVLSDMIFKLAYRQLLTYKNLAIAAERFHFIMVCIVQKNGANDLIFWH